MSAIVCFDIRNFSTHVSHLVAGNQGKTKRIFDVVKNVFQDLNNGITLSHKTFGLRGKTYVVHTGDGFVAIFYGKGKRLQALFVACAIGKSFVNMIDKYNDSSKNEATLRNLPALGYGIGIHIGSVQRFDYQPIYSTDGQTQGIGLLGHAINVTSRIQDTTKDHVFDIICTKKVFEDAISGIVEAHKKRFEGYFTNLGRHKLRGMRTPVTLYGVNISLGKKITPKIIEM